MKKVDIINADGDGITTVYIGTTSRIKAVYNSLWRADHKCKTCLWSIYSDKARFNPNKVGYGLVIEWGSDGGGTYKVVSLEDAIWMVSHGEEIAEVIIR